jgi:hypothetical protein
VLRKRAKGLIAELWGRGRPEFTQFGDCGFLGRGKPNASFQPALMPPHLTPSRRLAQPDRRAKDGPNTSYQIGQVEQGGEGSNHCADS